MKKELLIKLRNRIAGEVFLPSGLCPEISSMIYNARNNPNDQKITYDEYILLMKYIQDNRPQRGKHYIDPNTLMDSRFYWTKHEVAPRLAWLNDKIKHFNKKTGK